MTRNGQRLLLLIDDEPAQRRLIAECHALRPELPILMLTANDSVAQAVAAMRAGATDFLVKPLAPERLLAALEACVAAQTSGELRPLTEKIPALLAFDEIVGDAPEFRAALGVAAKAARARVAVLIEGEGGVGKESLAEAIHVASPRAQREMVRVNCAATPANMLDSIIFGHEEGAFAGAFERRIGKIVEADGSTLFLDEIAGMPLDTQGRLLDMLQTGAIVPLGARHAREVDVRVIAAADGRLLEAVEAGRFREDLYYKLNVVHVAIPPLRDRADDIPALTRHLLDRIAQQPGLFALDITDEALDLLRRYDWPGNVRQLQNALFRAAVLCEGDALTAADFPQIASLGDRPSTASGPQSTLHNGGINLFRPDGNLRPLEDIEADVIRLAIGHYRGRMTEVARRLGIGRSTLYRKLGELGIDNAA